MARHSRGRQTTEQLSISEGGLFLEAFLDEWQTLRRLRHPFLVQLLGVLEASGERAVSLVLERLHTTLRRRSQSTPSLGVGTTVRLCGEVLCALAYLHAQKVVHGSLSTNNVLLTRGTEPTAKLSDAWLSKVLESERFTADGALAPSRRLASSGFDILFAPPERTESNRSLSDKQDVFSYGVVALSACTRCEPTCAIGPQPAQVPDADRNVHSCPEVERRSQDIRKLPSDHPLHEIILKCLCNDPSDRPTASDLIHELEKLPAVTATSAENEGSARSTDCKAGAAQDQEKAPVVSKNSASTTSTKEEQSSSTIKVRTRTTSGISFFDDDDDEGPWSVPLTPGKSGAVADPLGLYQNLRQDVEKANRQRRKAEERSRQAAEKALEHKEGEKQALQQLKAVAEKLQYAEGRIQLADGRAEAAENALRAERRCAQAAEDRARWLQEQLVAAEQLLRQTDQKPQQQAPSGLKPLLPARQFSYGELSDRAISSYSNTESCTSVGSAPKHGLSTLSSPRGGTPFASYSSSPLFSEVHPLPPRSDSMLPNCAHAKSSTPGVRETAGKKKVC